jgi:hypothetical protein
MAETPLETADEILAGVLEETADSDVRYKLRRARQLLEVVDMRLEEVDAALDNGDIDEALRADLREWGTWSERAP